MHTLQLIISITIALLISGCGATRNSIIPSEHPLPSHLASQSSPINTIPLKASEVDIVRQLDNNQLLISTMKTEGFMQNYELNDKDLQLIDTTKSTVLWKVTLSDLNLYIRDLTITPYHVIVVGTEKDTYLRKVIALKRKTGITDWSYVAEKAVTTTRYAISQDQKNIVLVNSSGDSLNLVSVNLYTGKKTWNKSFKGKINEKNYVPFTVKGIKNIIIVITDKLTAFNVASGKQLWSYSFNITGGLSDVNFIDRGNLLFFYSPQKILAIDPARGKINWSLTRKDGEFIAPVAIGNSLLITERNKNKLIVRRIDSQSNKQRWKTVFTDARSTIFNHGNNFYYTTRDKLIKMNFSRGKVLTRYSLPKYLQTQDGLADILSIEGQNIIVAREEGVVAYDLKNGRLKYTQPIYGGKAFTYAFLENKLKLRNIARRGGASDPGFLVSSIAQANIDMQYGMSTGYNETTSKAMGYNVSGSSMALAQATKLMGATLSMGASFREGAVSSSLRINKRQIEAALASQQHSIQHGFYVRPFYKKGWGVTLVRLQDGKRVDLYVSPPNEPLQLNSGNFPVFLINPLKNQLIAKGLGLRPDATQTYQKVAFDKEVYKTWPGIPDNWIIPFSSLLTFDLNKLDFTNIKQTLPVLTSRIGKNERQLREAVMTGNTQKVKQLVSKGADINAVDRFGYNILFYAAMMDRKQMVEYLIEQGANATLRDAHGWLAYHYTFLTHAMNKSTEPIRQANFKQNAAGN